MTTAADYQHLMKGRDGKFEVKYEGDIAIIYMDRGENRMNDLFIESFNSALDEVESKENVKAVITTGVGKFYCNGLDLEWMMQLGINVPSHLTQFLKKWHELLARILTFPVLTIAALNGHCFAGGGLLMLAHDYRIMNTERGWFCLNEIHLNLRFSPWMMKLIKIRLTSPRASTEVVLLGKRYTAKEALECKIIEDAAPQADLIKAGFGLAAKVLPPNQPISRSSLLNMKLDLYKEILDVMANNQQEMVNSFSRM